MEAVAKRLLSQSCMPTNRVCVCHEDGAYLEQNSVDASHCQTNREKLAPVKHARLTTSASDQPVAIRLKSGEDIDSVTLETVHDMISSSVHKFSQLNALAYQELGENRWKFWTYQQFYDECLTAAKGFLQLGLERFNAVCILGFTSPCWFFANVGAIFAGGVGCGIYTTNKPDACYYVLQRTSANIAVVENSSQLAKIVQIWNKLPNLKAIIQWTGEVDTDDDRVYSWRKFSEVGDVISDATVHDVISRQKVNQCCQIIFTSGTTGTPKGVLLSHDNITSTARRLVEWAGLKHEVILSYLPLSHIAAQMSDLWSSVAAGNTVYFAKPDVLKGSLSQTLKTVRPTAFIAVPRVWEKVANKLQVDFEQRSAPQRKIVQICQNIGFNSIVKGAEGSSSTPFGFTLANSIAFKKWLVALGLDRCWLVASCAAPLGEDTQRFLWKHHVPLVEIYGLSESTGPHTACLSTPGYYKFRSVGRALPGHLTKLADDGSNEIYLWGRNVMMGYLGMPEATERAIDPDGWLHTGDIGRVEGDDFMFVTGRIKDLIITAGGENIPTSLIEERVKSELPMISHCVLVGDDRRFVSVLVTIKCEVDDDGIPTDKLAPKTTEHLRKCGSNATSVHELVSGRDEHFVEAMKLGFQKVNSLATSRAQTIRRWSMLPGEFTIGDGELGPTLKVRRPFVLNKYKNLIAAIYAESPSAKFIVYDVQ